MVSSRDATGEESTDQVKLMRPRLEHCGLESGLNLTEKHPKRKCLCQIQRLMNANAACMMFGGGNYLKMLISWENLFNLRTVLNPETEEQIKILMNCL